MGRGIFQGIFSATLALFSWTVFASTPGAGALDKVVAPILAKRPGLAKGSFGIEIQDAATGTSLYSRNADAGLNPASALKILVSAVALEELGLGHTFKTRVRRAGDTLCLVGGGDPALVQESLKELAEVVSLFLRPVAAPQALVVDESLFPGEKPFDASFAGDDARAFTADIGSLSVSFNSIAVRVAPTALGKPGRVMLSPDIAEFAVVNRTVTSSTGNKKSLAVDLRRHGAGYRVEVSGNVSVQQGFFTLYASIPEDPAWFAGLIFKKALAANGVAVGGMRKERCPAGAVDVFAWESKPLAAIVGDMNVYSNNFIAEMLLRGLEPTHARAAGLARVREWLRARGIDAAQIALENASGLSRANRIPARALASVFRAAMLDPATGPEFLASMSVNGATGTLRNRMKDPGGANVIRAKSGTLSDTVSLVGRAQRGDRDYVFAFLFNRVPYAPYELQSMENEVLDAVLRAP